MKNKILFISGIRSDYDLLKPLASSLKTKKNFDIYFHLCEPHFSVNHNLSYKIVVKDKFKVINIDTSFKSVFYDDTNQRVKAFGRTVLDINKSISLINPSLVIYLGDREEPMAAAIACAYNNIPTLHIAGGDNCYPNGGDVDEPVRHAISKLSSLHLVIANEHKSRLIKMGEPEDRIKFVGNPGLDSIALTPKISLESITQIPRKFLNNKYAVLIYHVMSSLSPKEALKEYRNILNALYEKEVKILIGAPNSDPGQFEILNHSEFFLKKNENAGYLYKNLPRLEFINILRNSNFIIGNSSLGILEANFLKKPAINVGERQKGRLHGNNVLFTGSDKNLIIEAIEKATSQEFLNKIDNETSNIYGDGSMVEKSVEFIMKNINRKDLLEKHITY